MTDSQTTYGFTKTAIEVLGKTVDCAKALKAPDQQSTPPLSPLHLFLVLLVGVDADFNKLEQLNPAPGRPSALWSTVSEMEHDPIQLAKIAKQWITTLRPNIVVTSSREHTWQRPTIRSREPKLLGIFKRSARGSRDPSPSPAASIVQEEHSDEPRGSDSFLDVIKTARNIKKELGDVFAGPYHMSLALLKDTSVAELLRDQNIPLEILEVKIKERRSTRINHADDDQFPFLARYATDMTALAREGKLNEIVGRDEEIRRVIQILCRRTKNSAVLLGEPGVGKTAVAEGIAYRIAHNQVPEHLKGIIYSLDLGSLFAGAQKGEYEARVKGVIDDVMRSQEGPNPVILFIDELHLITVGKGSGGQGSGMDAANLLKPALARGQFRCIGATTLAEYREHIEKDGALERRFATVIVNEPTVEEAQTILRGIRERYELYHNVWIRDEAITTAAKLAYRYLTGRRLPDSAVDLMDEACASARVSRDMKPEAIDAVEQELLQITTRIRGLERDNHPNDDQALEEAKTAKVKLERKKNVLDMQQRAVVEWWKDISVRRGRIQTKKVELATAQGAQPFKPDRVTALESELRALREGLVVLEREGPGIPESDPDVDGSNRSLRISPDVITSESIAAVVERATKIPVQRLLAPDKSRLLNLEATLSQEVVGQPEAVRAVTNAIQLSRTGLANQNRPVASLLFTGPSGTGKTLLSKALAKELFGQETSMVRIDGSEYSQSHSISRLIGSPPGYVGYDQGGQLTEYVRRTPYSIVLLDEIEKTCTEFLTLFLQVLDEGRLTDGQGRLIDFRNTVIIMTSNVGADILSNVEQSKIPDTDRDKVMARFKEKVPVEFLNRIDEVVMFHTMSAPVMRTILDKHLSDVQRREGLKNMRLDLDENAKSWLTSAGISREYGARPLARVLQRELLNPLSQRLLENTVREGETVLVRVNDAKKGLKVIPNHDAGEEPAAATTSPPRRRERARR